MSLKIFNNFTDFYHFVNQNPWTVEHNADVQEMKRLIAEMNGTCPCKRGQYMPQIESKYLALGGSLSNIEKISLKDVLGAEQVQMHHNGGIFLTF